MDEGPEDRRCHKRETDRALRGHHRQGYSLWGPGPGVPRPRTRSQLQRDRQGRGLVHGPVWHRVSERERPLL